jgi:hypothetical protein
MEDGQLQINEIKVTRTVSQLLATGLTSTLTITYSLEQAQ